MPRDYKKARVKTVKKMKKISNNPSEVLKKQELIPFSGVIKKVINFSKYDK